MPRKARPPQSRPPYCLDRLDLDALNATDPGKIGSGFQLPGWYHDQAARRAERKRNAEERAMRRWQREEERRRRAELPPPPF